MPRTNRHLVEQSKSVDHLGPDILSSSDVVQDLYVAEIQARKHALGPSC